MARVFVFLLVSALLDHSWVVAAAPAKPFDLKEARAAYTAKNFDKVIALLSPKLDEVPREGFLLLAAAYTETKNPSMTLKTLTLAHGKFPTDDEMQTLLGVSLIENRKEREAKATLKEVIDRNPKFEQAYLRMADLYAEKNNRYELRIIYQDLIKKIDRKPEYLMKLCELFTLDGIYDQAKSHCDEAITLNPREPMNYVNLATTYNSTGKVAEAETTFKKVAESFSKNEPAQYSYGQFLEEQKKWVEAFKYYKRGSDADPKATRSWLGMAFSAIEVQKFDDSIAAFEKLCELDNRNAIKHTRRATSLVLKMNQPDVLRKFQALVEKCDSSPRNFF